MFIIGLVVIQAGCVRRGADWPKVGGVIERTEAPSSAKFPYHMVAKDETMSGIARQYNLNVQDLAQANNLDKPYVIKEGERLLIPGRITERAAEKILEVKPTTDRDEQSDSKLAWPISGKVIQGFGRGDAVRRNGITIEGTFGAKVRAAEAGKVGHVGEIPGLGKVVLIDHSDGLVTVYAHLNETTVLVGDKVSRNQVIGALVGSQKTKDPTLYFEVRSHARPTNPIKFLGSRH
ncbi:MAG: peptidoglycan DD-metalloendopeptidase family protein [Desulfomonilaceae bacterium]